MSFLNWISSKALHLQAPGIFGPLLQLQQLRTAQRRRDAFSMCHRTLPRRCRSRCPHGTKSDRRPLKGECRNQHELIATNINKPNKQRVPNKLNITTCPSCGVHFCTVYDGDTWKRTSSVSSFYNARAGADRRKCQCNHCKAECNLLLKKTEVKCQLNLFIYKNNISHHFTTFHPKKTLTLVFPLTCPLNPLRSLRFVHVMLSPDS